ncbi:hypothetical protein THAOC_27991, partial [Thalassiosira oceanica]
MYRTTVRKRYKSTTPKRVPNSPESESFFRVDWSVHLTAWASGLTKVNATSLVELACCTGLPSSRDAPRKLPTRITVASRPDTPKRVPNSPESEVHAIEASTLLRNFMTKIVGRGMGEAHTRRVVCRPYNMTVCRGAVVPWPAAERGDAGGVACLEEGTTAAFRTSGGNDSATQKSISIAVTAAPLGAEGRAPISQRSWEGWSSPFLRASFQPRWTNRQPECRQCRQCRLHTAPLSLLSFLDSLVMMMRPRDSKRARPLPDPTLLEALDNDLLVRCASYLDADGLARLGRASAAFGTPQAGQQRSLANEAAHQRFRQSATDEERGCLPKHNDESDIGLYRALEQLREPLSFDELAGDGFSPQENLARVNHTYRGGLSTAVSGHVMRGGRHFVEFAITYVFDRYVPNVYLGVIRPVSLTNGIDLGADDWGWSVDPVYVASRHKPAVSEKLRSQRTSRWGDSDIHCCGYYSYDGRCEGTDWDTGETDDEWHGREGLDGSGTIG